MYPYYSAPTSIVVIPAAPPAFYNPTWQAMRIGDNALRQIDANGWLAANGPLLVNIIVQGNPNLMMFEDVIEAGAFITLYLSTAATSTLVAGDEPVISIKLMAQSAINAPINSATFYIRQPLLAKLPDPFGPPPAFTIVLPYLNTKTLVLNGQLVGFKHIQA